MAKKNKKKKKDFVVRPLSGLSRLKKAAATGDPVPPPVEDRKKPDVEEAFPQDEEDLFYQAMSGVRPIRARDDTLPPEPLISASLSWEEREEAEVMQALRELVEGEAPLSIHETDEAIEGAVEGLDPRILARLRRGEYSVQDHLDLHRLTRDQARERVEAFLLDAIAQGKRCVLIIHGRGHGSKDHVPVLKNALRNWFTRRALKKKILAFSTAQTFDGGAGAVYVLLKRFRPRSP